MKKYSIKKLKSFANEINYGSANYNTSSSFFLNTMYKFLEELLQAAPISLIKAYIFKSYFEELDGVAIYKSRLFSAYNLDEIS